MSVNNGNEDSTFTRIRPNKVLFKSDSKLEDLRDEVDAKIGKKPSLFSFLRTELTRGYLLENDEERYSAKREKIYSFMKIPLEVEKFILYGFMQCTDSFLFVYTFLPVRVALALWALVTRPFSRCFGRSNQHRESILTPAEICDFLKAVIIIICSVTMFSVDTNMLYHLIKSQSIIKLYIFYNMLEVGDRLFSSFGQDTIDALFWTATEPRDRKRQHLGVIPHLIFALVYVFCHSMLVLFQATTLNVAINSNNKGLLTIMMSNNFVELKGSVFKKFDKNNLFQVSCSDVRERFHLLILLFIVMLQTMREYSWKTERLSMLLPDCVIVLVVELFIDWIKHAFITRFNELQVDVYKDYTISLAYDMAQTRQKHAFSDDSDLVARRMGFIPIPLGVVMIRVLASAIDFNNMASIVILLLIFVCLLALKILNTIIILGAACELIAQHRLEKATVLINSPFTNRAASPLTTVHPPQTTQTAKDCATSPFKTPVHSPPDVATPKNRYSASSNGFGPLDIEVKRVEELSDDGGVLLPPASLGVSAIFENSTVDLKNVALNEELLKVEGDDIKLETPEFSEVTRSYPNIKGDFQDQDNPNGLKRAESEPFLNTGNSEDIIQDQPK